MDRCRASQWRLRSFFKKMRHRWRTKGVKPVITHNIPVDSPNSSANPTLSLQEQHTILRKLRQQLLTRYRPIIQQGAGPIRVMARMVAELERRCREFNISEEVMRSEIVNRTIGDVDLRRVTECEGDPGGPGPPSHSVTRRRSTSPIVRFTISDRITSSEMLNSRQRRSSSATMRAMTRIGPAPCWIIGR